MMDMTCQHRLKRARPTDVTGLFWALACLTVGAVLFLAAVPIIGLLMLAATPFFLADQIVTWRSEFLAKRDALFWCNKYYTSEMALPLVDFMIAFSLYTRCDLKQIDPSTHLSDIYGALDENNGWLDVHNFEWHQVWLASVFRNARIKKYDLKSFRGERLGDVIKFAEAIAG